MSLLVGMVQDFTLAALASPVLLYAGLAAVAVPILIHLLNRRRFRRIRWAAVDFLLQADRENRRRIRIEEMILLALRCLAMLLVGLMLARWFVRPESLAAALGSRGQAARIVVLDDSYSMGLQDRGPAAQGSTGSAATVFDQATGAVRQLVRSWRESSPGDHLTLLLASRPDEPIRSDLRIGPIDDKTFGQILASLRVSSRAGRFPAVMTAVRRRLGTLPAGTNAVVCVVSDFQRIDWSGGEQTPAGANRSPMSVLSDWADKSRTLEVVLVDVGTNPPGNLAVTGLEPQQSQTVATIEGRFVARITNYSATPSAPTSLSTYVGDAALPPAPVPAIEPGQTAEVAFDATFPTEAVEVLSVELPPDGLDIDNARRIAVPVAKLLRVLVASGERATDPYEDETFLLTVALQPEGPQFSGNEVTVVDDNDLETADLSEYHVVVLANVYRITESVADRLESYVATGGGLMIFLGDQVDAGIYNSLLDRSGRELLPARLGETVACPAESAGWGVGAIEAGHPLTRHLAYTGARLFGQVRVRQYVRCLVPESAATTATSTATSSAPAAAGATVLARLDGPDKDPLLIARSYRGGHVLLFASSADKEWNNLPDQPAYVVLLMEAVQYLARRPEGGGGLTVGEPVRLPFDAGRFQPTVSMRPPSFPASPAERIEPQPDPATGRPVLAWGHTDTPGVYLFELAEIVGRSVALPVAVNVDTRESDLRRAGEAALRAAMPDLNVQYVAGRELAALGEDQVRRELWPLALVVLVAVLMGEQFLGWYFGCGRDLGLLWRGVQQ